MNARIYLVTNNLNGKQYVGQTITNDQKGHGKLCTAAYRKYGKENFSYDVICSNINNQATLNFIERFWVKVMDCRIPNGYNIDHGGNSRGKIAVESKYKMRLAKLGKKQTPEHIAKVVSALKNRSPEVKQKAGDKLRGRKRPAHIGQIVKLIHTGKIVSEETKAKIREARKNQVFSEETKQKLSNAAKRQWARQKGVM